MVAQSHGALAAMFAEKYPPLGNVPLAWLEAMPVAIYACDRSGRLLWCNRRAEALWGRAPRVGDDSELFCGSYRVYRRDGSPLTPAETPMASVLATGQPVEDAELALERPDGSRVGTMMHVGPVKSADGEVRGAIACFHETTGNLEIAETFRRTSEAQFRQLLDALPAAIYTTDAEGRITYYNRAAVEMSGNEPKLGVDKWCVTWKLYHPDGRPMPHDECPMAVTLRENRPVRGAEAVAERPDGTRIPFIPYPTPLRDADGRLIGAINMLADVSERKQAEAHQNVLLDELNHRVKNNMQMLQALLRTAQRGAQSAEARSVLADAERRVAAMGAAQHVLYEAGTPTRYEARDFLEAVCASAKLAFTKKIEIVIEQASGTLLNDSAMPLALILNELLMNAVKHGVNGQGEGTIRVGLRPEGESLVLFVEDDGPGFDPQEVPMRGSGLGLVTGLARQLGGNFEVDRDACTRCVVRFDQRGISASG
jgi:PAS domain S-box-containing protein